MKIKTIMINMSIGIASLSDIQEPLHALGEGCKASVVIHASVVISLVPCRPYENVVVPLIIEVPHVAYREINVLSRFVTDKGGKVVMIAPDIHEFPTVKFAEGTKIIDILCLKGLVVFARIYVRTECMGKILAKFV